MYWQYVLKLKKLLLILLVIFFFIYSAFLTSKDFFLHNFLFNNIPVLIRAVIQNVINVALPQDDLWAALFIHWGKISVVSSHVAVEHNILFDSTADRFILVVICGSHKETSGICES